MDKIYQEILEAIELKKENEAKIAELEGKLAENLAKGQEFNNRTFSADKESVEYQVELREKQKRDIESDKMKIEKQSFENEVNGKIDAIKSKLQIMIAEEKLKLEDNEKKYRQNVLNNIEKNDAMENWNNFYGEELFSDVQNSDELEGYLSNVEDKSNQMLDNIKKMESVYNQLSSENIEKLAEEASKNIGNFKIEEPTTVEQQKNNENQGEYMNRSQEEHIKETRIRICEDVFAKKEKGFEDILTSEYEQLKNSILALADKNPDKLREIMYKISDMTLEDIYEDIIKTVQKSGNEDKANSIAKNLEKIKARREELNPKKEGPKKEEPKKDEPKKDEPKKDEPKKDESKKDEPKKDESKKDEPKKEEPKKNEPKKDESKEEEPKPYEKTTISVDTKNNKIIICVKGKTQPYEVSDNEHIKQYIKNGKEYKKDKGYKKDFGKKELKKVDPSLLGILVGLGEIDAAKEYVDSFRKGQPSLVDVKYTFSDHTVGVPMQTVKNYKDSAKKAEKRGVATVEGLSRGPIGMLMRWNKANQASRLESAEMKKHRIELDNKDAERAQQKEKEKIDKKQAKKEKRATRREKIGRKILGEEYDNIKKTVEAGREEKEATKEEKSSFKEEMKKDAPSAEKQAKTAKEFEEKEKQNGKAKKRERKDKDVGTK